VKTTTMNIVLLAFLCSAGGTEAGERKVEELLMVGAAAADIVATELWIRHETPYGTPAEGNFVMGDTTAKRILVKGATLAAGIFLARELEARGRPTAAKVVRWVHVGTGLGSAGWNVGLMVRF